MSATRPGLRTVLLLAGTWLAGAAIAVTVGFFAVDRVGEDLNNGNSVPTPDVELRQAAEQATSPAATTSTPPTTDTPSTSSSKSVPPEDEVDTSSPTAGEPTPGPQAQTRRFTTEGGAVAASCTGATITLLYAYPNDGYTSEVSTSAKTIEVEFHSREEVHVRITCAGGVPTRVEQEGEETEDH